MNKQNYDVILVTEDRYVDPMRLDWYTLQVLLEDELVKQALQEMGLAVSIKSWSDKSFNWRHTKTALIRTTWDYFERLDEFRDWMAVVAEQTQLINEPSLLKWNIDKHYLLDLASRGINTVPTTIINKQSTLSILDWLTQINEEQAIIKPTISGAARHTYRVDQKNHLSIQKQLEHLLHNEDMMIQPFQHSVTEFGELSLVVINGRSTHAVRKIAASGDFRVQDDHGGHVVHYEPTRQEIEFAEVAVRACDPLPLYARVDMVYDNNQNLAIMELELIEPELFFRFNRIAAHELAKALYTRLF